MGKTKGKVNVVTLFCGTVTYAGNFQSFGKALGYADNHIINESTGQTVHGAMFFVVARTFNGDNAVLHGKFHFFVDLAGKFAFRALNGNKVVFDGNCYASGHGNWMLTNSRHL